jgi:16S rRNA (adenine1518-N6/adenine1519-N6)-dimethyltransferase
VEIDPLLLAILKTQKELSSVKFIQGDILELDLADLPIPRPVRVVGNIPYNISSSIIFWLIKQRDHWKDAFLMVQKEMADRLVAKVGSKEYGRLTVMTRAFFDIDLCFTIPPHVFIPRPKVESSFVSLKKKDLPLVEEDQFAIFEKLVGTAFAQRRKMLKNTLAGFSISESEESPVDLHRRPEQLTVEEFVSLLEQMHR